jgi:predicted DNA-binding antitoxin AbrB/MazE fold protein
MAKTIKARFSKGVIEPLGKVDIAEGEEITVTIVEISKTEEEDPLDTTFGGWADTIDCEELKKNIYDDRLITTRPKVKL